MEVHESFFRVRFSTPVDKAKVALPHTREKRYLSYVE